MSGSAITGAATPGGATAALLVEIGCEEIPARFLQAAEHEFGKRLSAALREARLLEPDGGAKTGSTPRRLVAYVPAMLGRQADRVNSVLGPSLKVAFDREGKPTRAAEAFAAKHHIQVSDLRRTHQGKGEYVTAEVREAGAEGLEVLRELLPRVIGNLSFPKSMYWTAKAGPRFVRPIRWILALLGEGHEPEVVPFEFAGVKSGSYTFGHRLKGSQPLDVTDLNHDLKLTEYWVEIHSDSRHERVQKGIKALVEGRGLAVARDKFLEDWVVNSTEWPVPLMGSFDSRYLALPREVLVTVMRDHQKYFAVEDSSGNLQPHFITVLNVPGDPKGLIRQGHERVLAARFADAEFFWNADQRVPLGDRVEMLARVTYQVKLGTYADKVERMQHLAREVCTAIQEGVASSTVRQHVLRAVELCKCDLTTQMVQEFTELQGVIGGLYAKAQRETPQVADAIYDHYKPVSVEDDCPRSIVGAIASLADKLDTVIAGFAAGLEPTGSSDPFAVRRAGNGVIKLAVEVLAGLKLTVVTNKAVGYAEQAIPGANDGTLSRRVDAFLRERTEFYFREVAGLRYDTVRAVLKPTRILQHLIPSDALSRAKALERARDTEDFLALAAAAKRTRNILGKSASEEDIAGASGEVDPTLLNEQAEKELRDAYEDLKEALVSLRAGGNYEEAFRAMATVRPQVDRFFDNVLVMAQDPKVRKNRLMLLVRLNQDVFTSLADLAEIAVEPRAEAATGA